MKVAVIGGDKRMLFAARAFLKDGCEVSISGFDNLMSMCDIRVMDIPDAVRWADIIVLPVRPISGNYLNCPFSADKTELDELMKIIGDKPVFSGCADHLKQYTDCTVFDYASREDFTYRNAELTAEAALGIILNDYECSVFGSECLVLGFGRIGKILSRCLKALNADVTVAARKLSDRSLIAVEGMNPVSYDEIEYDKYDIIFNTVPAAVVKDRDIDRMRENVFIIDLASTPGGVDFDAVKKRGLSCVHALSLPGKTAPLSAGIIIKDTIISMIKEEKVGKDKNRLCDDRLLLHLG